MFFRKHFLFGGSIRFPVGVAPDLKGDQLAPHSREGIAHDETA